VLLLNVIKRWLGIAALESEIERLRTENAALKEGRAVVLPDGKLAIADKPVTQVLRPRAHTFNQYARRKEAEAWRDLVNEAYPGAGKSKD